MAKRNVQCVKPSDPPFLRRMKEQCGFTQTTIETKKQALQMDPDADKDGDDELPQVVVLTPGDLTQDEADKILKRKGADEDADHGSSKTASSMKFSTKSKRSGDRKSDEQTEQKKKKLQDDLKKKNNVKGVKNSNLLSFDEDGDEEDY